MLWRVEGASGGLCAYHEWRDVVEWGFTLPIGIGQRSPAVRMPLQETWRRIAPEWARERYSEFAGRFREQGYEVSVSPGVTPTFGMRMRSQG